MKTFESKIRINRPAKDVYSFLADLNNHKQLMPENIVDWTSTYNEASFNIQNMAKLSLKVDSREDNKEIKIIPSEKPPFDLTLTWRLSPGEGYTDVQFTITADLNMMMKMLASGPLQDLADYETQSLVTILI